LKGTGIPQQDEDMGQNPYAEFYRNKEEASNNVVLHEWMHWISLEDKPTPHQLNPEIELIQERH
jgi:hypothetical protein